MFGALSSIQYKNANGTTADYYVRCTLSNDVEQIYDPNGNLLARYIYDTWGKTVMIVDGSGNEILTGNHIAVINPIRYRGYNFDGESGLYYLQSRYYDPVTKRFVNAVNLLGANADGAQYNLFSYCGNNPVNISDPTGEAAIAIAGAGIGVATILKGIAVGVSAALAVTIVSKAIDSPAWGRPRVAQSQASSRSDSKVKDIPIIDTRQGNPEPLYFGADTYGGVWKTVTPVMTFNDARQWIDSTADAHLYGKHASWGLYIENGSDALKMAMSCFDPTSLDAKLIEAEHHGSEQYNHFHPPGHVYKDYGHIHFWYGSLY